MPDKNIIHSHEKSFQPFRAEEKKPCFMGAYLPNIHRIQLCPKHLLMTLSVYAKGGDAMVPESGNGLQEKRLGC